MGRRKFYNDVIGSLYLFLFISAVCYGFYVFYDTPYYAVLQQPLPVIPAKKSLMPVEPKVWYELYKKCFGVEFKFGLDEKGVMLHHSYLFFSGRKAYYNDFGHAFDMPIVHIMATRPFAVLPHGYSYVITYHLQYPLAKYFYDQPHEIFADPGFMELDFFSLCFPFCVFMVYFTLLGYGFRAHYVAIIMLPCVYLFTNPIWY